MIIAKGKTENFITSVFCFCLKFFLASSNDFKILLITFQIFAMS